MPQIKVYHNPNFLDYRGQHTDIIPPTRPVATIHVPEETPVKEALEFAFRQTQHLDRSWWENEGIRLHVRSTSVGDVLADPQGNLFVVENAGLKPYRPKAIRPWHRLAAAYRLLAGALTQENVVPIMTVASQVRDAMLFVLETEGYPQGEIPILPLRQAQGRLWDKAQSGDLVGNPSTGLFRVIARKLRPKWRAKRLLAHIPDAQLWIDSPRSWAVLVPVNETA